MKALVYYGPHDIRYEEVATPVPKKEESACTCEIRFDMRFGFVGIQSSICNAGSWTHYGA